VLCFGTLVLLEGEESTFFVVSVPLARDHREESR
jgi:hypothetical protein